MPRRTRCLSTKPCIETLSPLDEACTGDDELRREVDSLLAYRERIGGFLTISALELAADTLAREDSRQPFPDVLTALFESDLETGRLPRLRVTTPSGSVETVALDRDSLSVGRGETNRIFFPEDDALSREHVIIEPSDGGWTVRDLESKNGTFLNGKRLEERQLLKPGDEISASCIPLTYYGDSRRG